MKKRKRIIVLLLIVLLWPCQVSKAASGLKLKMNGSLLDYSGIQVKVTIDGKQVQVKDNPGIIINHIALVPYDVVFQKGLGATCQYNESAKTVTIRKDDATVKMTVGSTVAYVNGKRKTVSVCPRTVYFCQSKITKIMIPSRFVTEALGYTYYWNKKENAVQITSPYALYYDKKWHKYSGTKGHVTVNGSAVNVSDMPTVVFEGFAFVQAKKVFENKALNAAYHYNQKDQTVKIENDYAYVKYTIGSKTAYVNQQKYSLKIAPKMVKDNVSNKSFIMIPAKFTAESLGYEYKWNTSTKTSEITVVKKRDWSWYSKGIKSSSACTDTLESVVVENVRGEEFVRFTGNTSLTMETDFIEKNNTLKISFANLNNITTKAVKKFSSNKNVKSITMSECETGNVTVTIQIADGTEYYEEDTGKCYSICFYSSDEESSTADSTESAVTLPIPKGVSFEQLTTEDCYYNKQFKVIMPGKHGASFENIPKSLPDGVKSIKCTQDSANKTILTFYTAKVLGYKISEQKDTFVVKVGNPKDIYKNIVVLDAGHGGSDPGTIHNGFREKDINYNILYQYAKTYFNKPDSPVKAYWTRTTDTLIALDDRAAFAKKVQADVFISLHMNSAGSVYASGAETFYTATNNKANSFGVTSKMLASYFQNHWPSKVGMGTSRGVKTANYVVTKKNTVPAILIELGFMSNKHDIDILGNGANQKKAAKTFYETVCSFFEQYPTGR
ncbi:N-acetylmuramoyl-L-alanine amidase [[Clostridium] polysaccharolyticum]|uniref:N-acetylmuramoyl-L-alanine amidase n=1 Tax=[Clostridium] polysaccharolyticum TaxID=29364 RepID=A0A1I0AAZ1_9FIRM|nr:N-acetylmuramoyl-L-alanine amidase [[Clostridium] polysaccharolyticum]SES90418.1 N-acetylmuramoyl-L-alanine amidase [[Clostridium] polysaccharolyticum]